MNSVRFPGKPLASILGQPMISHVYRGTAASPLLTRVIAATDSTEIYDTVRSFGGEAFLTRADHRTGTDRICEVIDELEKKSPEPVCDIVLNIQGDEPLICPELIEQLTAPFLSDSKAVMTTLKKKIISDNDVTNPNIVKVVTDRSGRALYFSRYPVPYASHTEGPSKNILRYRHIGMYGFTLSFLRTFASLAPGVLEKSESLEQLRALENGFPIHVSETTCDTVDVNIPEDVFFAEKCLREKKY